MTDYASSPLVTRCRTSKAYWQTTTPEIQLTGLSPEAGVHLLKKLGVKGSKKEIETLVEDVKGHALTLNLLGTYLRDAHAGNILRRDPVKLEEAKSRNKVVTPFVLLKPMHANLRKKVIKASAPLRSCDYSASLIAL